MGMTIKERKRKDVLIKLNRQPVFLCQSPATGLIDLEAQMWRYIREIRGAGFTFVRSADEANYCMLFISPDEDEDETHTCVVKSFKRTYNGMWKTKVSGGEKRIVDEIRPTGVKFLNQSGKWERMIARHRYPLYFK